MSHCFSVTVIVVIQNIKETIQKNISLKTDMNKELCGFNERLFYVNRRC